MQPVEDLLREALRNGDEQGWAQVRGRHLPNDLMADLAKQTHLYALEHGPDGRRVPSAVHASRRCRQTAHGAGPGLSSASARYTALRAARLSDR
jgi:hypothetical protein